MSKNGATSIVLKVLIALFALILIFILTVPPKIWQSEDSSISKERRHMRSINEAESFFRRATQMYSLDFDSIQYLISQDSSLQDRKKVAEATQGVYYSIKGILENDLISTLVLISNNYEDMVNDFEDPEKMAVINRKIEGKEELSHNLKIAADSLYHTLRALPMLKEYGNVVATANAARNLEKLSKNIADEKLSSALYKSFALTDTLKILLKNFNADKALEYFQKNTGPLVKQFSDLFFELELEKRSPFAERTVSFQAQIEFALNKINDSDFKADYQKYVSEAGIIEGGYNASLETYAKLLNRYATLNITEEDSLLLEFRKGYLNSVMEPGKEIYVGFDTTFKNLAIESPVLFEYARENSTPLREKVNSLKLKSDFNDLFNAMDSLSIAVEQNLNQLRNNVSYKEDRKKANTITLELKSVPYMYKNFMKNPVINYGHDFLLAADELNSNGRFSKIQSGLQGTYKLLSYFASLNDSNRVAQVADVMDNILDETAKIDTMFSEITFRRSKIEWRSLRESVSPAHERLLVIVNDLKNDYETFNTLSEEAIEQFKNNDDGVTVYHYGIFPVSVKNPGYVENGKESWKEEK